jgi:hypothetical protein
MERGQKAHNLGPLITLRLDGQVIRKTMLMEKGWMSLIFTPPIDVGDHVWSVSFTNGFRDKKLKQDRNVYL